MCTKWSMPRRANGTAAISWRCRDCKRAVHGPDRHRFMRSPDFRTPALVLHVLESAHQRKASRLSKSSRHCQISYKSALFLMTRIRFAMAPDGTEPQLKGTVECDETYFCHRKPRYPGTSKRGRGTSKTPVFVAVEDAILNGDRGQGLGLPLDFHALPWLRPPRCKPSLQRPGHTWAARCVRPR